MSENICHILGTLTKDPELRYSKNGTPLAILRIATERKLSSKVTKEKITDFHNAKIWGESAELIAQTFKKGQRIFITGNIENENYVDSQGIKHYGYAINIKSFSYIEKKEKQAEQVNEPNPEEKTDFKNQDMQSGEIIKF